MGKRKSSSKPQGPKKREPLETVFACLFCNHEKSVTVKLDKKAGVGKLECKVCGQSFQCGVNYLSAGVDVYSEWVDACDAVAKENSGDGASTSTRKAPGRMRFDDLDQDDEELGGGYGAEGVVGDDEED